MNVLGNSCPGHLENVIICKEPFWPIGKEKNIAQLIAGHAVESGFMTSEQQIC